IHPTVAAKDTHKSFGTFFSWIEKLRMGNESLPEDPAFQRWLRAEKVSLKDLHDIADAGKEWEYRTALERKILMIRGNAEIKAIENRLKERCHDTPCDLSWLRETADSELVCKELCRLVSRLEIVARGALSEKKYDISGRALMLASSILADFMDDESCCQLNACSDAAIRCSALLDKLKKSSTHRLPETEIAQAVDDIFKIRRASMNENNAEFLHFCSNLLERLAFRMTELTISDGFRRYLDPSETSAIKFLRTGEPARAGHWMLSVASARVDLAGGWSDTPPICYEYGGSVTGMAVLVDKYYPLSCRCRVVPGSKGIRLRSEMRDISTGTLLSYQHDEINSVSDIKGFRDPSAACALLKAALICLGIVTEEQITESSVALQTLLKSFCSVQEDVRMEIVTTSLLGLGTGMGTSSILGACILQSIAKTVGIGELEDEHLLHSVLMLEQILSSGGGWQDQAHGIAPGVKTVRSRPPKIPMSIHIEPLELDDQSMAAFEERLMFAYTGHTRLAKNILQQVLRRWSRRTTEIVETVENLVTFSEEVREAYLQKDWNGVAQGMQNGYRMKCMMAGEESGAEPESVKVFMSMLLQADLIKGAMLCGAGGGGFLLLVCSENVSESDIKSFFRTSIAPQRKDFENFSFHGCCIARKGLTTSLMDDPDIDSESFDLSWHRG
ncbi:MAG: hypothetical protein SGILL_009617, partial [Bacillariaceae sp.]